MTSITLDCKDKNVVDIIHWCDSNFGESTWDFYCAFPSYRWTFTVPSEQAANWLKLKWQ